VGKFIDLTGKRFGPYNADIYVIERVFPNGKTGEARWLVRHSESRGGCGLERIITTSRAKEGRCSCRRGIHFKEQTKRAARGVKGRQDPLTDKAKANIGASARLRSEITKLPHDKRGRALKRNKARGGGTGQGRSRDYQGDEAARHLAAARAYRERQREKKTGRKAPRGYDGVVVVIKPGRGGVRRPEIK
jgi:hypothetical protein